LSKAEWNYSQIEKEALALVFGIKKFLKYLFGRIFSLVTDHKPLMFILNPKSDLPPISAACIQRFAIFLSTYDYSTECKNTKVHTNADSLPRLPIEGDEEDTVDNLFKVSPVDGLPIAAIDIATETIKDSVLSHFYPYVLQGWPQKNVSNGLKPFYQRRDQLSTDQGCWLWGTMVIIPD